MRPKSKLLVALKIIEGHHSRLSSHQLDLLYEAIISCDTVSEPYYLVCSVFVGETTPNVAALEAIKRNTVKAIQSGSDEKIYYASLLLTTLQSRWNCYLDLLEICQFSLNLSGDERYRDLVYPASIVLGLCAFCDSSESLRKEISAYGRAFVDRHDMELAQHMAIALCLADAGNTPSCFTRDYDLEKLFTSVV